MNPLVTDPRIESMEAVAADDARPVTDSETATRLILTALNDKRYNWRTLDGLVHDTGLPAPVVMYHLKTTLADKVIRSSERDDEGRSLFTLRERYRESRGLLGRLLSALSDQVR